MPHPKLTTRAHKASILFSCLLGPTFAAGDVQSVATYQLTNEQAVQTFETFQECDVCPEMIVMPLGSFMMGAIEGESRNPFDFYGPNATGRKRGTDEINIMPSEHPRHPVEIDIPFAIGRNEVTHAEWMACVEDGGCTHNPDHRDLVFAKGYVTLGPKHPAINVSFNDIQQYVDWLNTKVGVVVYRLPTEAEWEYAARAGTMTRFAQGDELTPDQANFGRGPTENLRGEPMPHLVDRRMSVEVDELDAANAWGLRHMSGNVAEVTLSCFTDEHLGLPRSSAYLDHALSSGPCRRTGKGGTSNTAMDGLRLASRTRPTEDYRRSFYGFRILRSF